MPRRNVDVIGWQANAKETCIDHLICRFPNPSFTVEFPKKWSKQKRMAFTRMWMEGKIDPEITITYKRMREGAAEEAFLAEHNVYEEN